MVSFQSIVKISFIGYDKEWHDNFKKEQSERIKNNPVAKEKNTFCREHYETEEDYLKAQKIDLSWFQSKYDEEEGEKRWKAKTEKWMNTLNSKSDEEINEINRRKVKKSGCFYSKAEKDIFNYLKKIFPKLTEQFCLKDINSNKRFLYDMALDDKIIEFNGDFWHANPLKYDETFINPYTKETFKEIRIKDDRKLKTAIQQRL